MKSSHNLQPSLHRFLRVPKALRTEIFTDCWTVAFMNKMWCAAEMWIPNLSCSCSQKRYDSFNSFEFQIFLDGCCFPAGELLLICCYSHIILIWCLGLSWGESLILLILIWSCSQAFGSECVYMCCQCKQDLIQIKDTEAGIAAQQPRHHQKRPSVSWWLCESTQLQFKARWTILLSVKKKRGISSIQIGSEHNGPESKWVPLLLKTVQTETKTSAAQKLKSELQFGPVSTSS